MLKHRSCRAIAVLTLVTLACFAGNVHAVAQAGTFSRALSFADMGLNQPLKLVGVDSEVSLPFGIRNDEAVVDARLELGIDFSPALLARLSHVVVRLNGEVVQTIRVDGEMTTLVMRKVMAVDPRLFTDYNHLSLQFAGHYTLECEDASHSSLWVQFSLDSMLQLQMVPLEQRAGLERLPEPFFDPRDNRPLVLPVVFAQRPEPELVEAAGVLASWFGNLADYRGASFPVVLDEWPERHAVMLMTNGNIPEWLDVEPTLQPRVFLRRHPDRPHHNLLVFHGQDASQLRQAVLGTVYGHPLLSGDSAVIESVIAPPERTIYDVPKWIRTDRPVRFAELVNHPEELQVRGRRPLPIRIGARIPPDLYTGYERVVDLDLRYRYSKPLRTDNSNLAVFINDRFIQSIRLESEEQTQGFKMRVPVLEAKRYEFERALEIPALQIESNNQLQFQFSLDFHSNDLCKDTPWDDVHAALDPDSRIDLTGFSHYVEMPNLALFVNAGYPFTRYADLSRTTLVLRDDYTNADVAAALTVIARMGSQTGVTASRFRVATASDRGDVERDLLLIGSQESAAAEQADQADSNRANSQSRSLLFENARRQLAARNNPQAANAPVEAQVIANGPLGGIVSYESAEAKGQTVVALLGTSADSLRQVVNALSDPGRRDLVRGAAAIIDENTVRVVDSRTSYSLGNLGWRDRLRIFLAKYPIVLSVLGVIAAVLLAIFTFQALRRIAVRRLEQD